MKIGIIIGSTRIGRRGDPVGSWVYEQATARGDADYDLIDLKDFDLPLLSSQTIPSAARGQYESEQETNWSEAVAACDGYVFITAEYNHSVPAALKNAFDCLYGEWVGKAVAFVSYGADGGVRAVEHWRQIVANLSMAGVRAQVPIKAFAEFDDSGNFNPEPLRTKQLDTLFEQLLAAVERQQN